MAFLYGELPAKAKRPLQAHLEACPACAAQVRTWRSSMSALDAWEAPLRPSRPVAVMPVLRWAAAAAAVLMIGFLVGRQSSPAAAEIAALKTSVAQLNDLVQNQSAVIRSNSIAAATSAAGAETIRLLTDYSAVQEAQRAADRQTVNLALHAFDRRLHRIDNDLETVAANTETGFQEAHENITRVASLSLASKN
jgi:hypothetical protein